MKKVKYFIIIFTIVIVLGSFFAPNIIEGMLPSVNVIKVKEINHFDYVSATGVIEQKNRQQIKSDYPIIVSEVLVNIGDTVKQGQPVIKVDREQTAKKIMETSSYATMAGVSTSEYFSSYQDAYSQIPAQILSDIEGIVESINTAGGEYVEKDGAIASMVSQGNLIVNVKVPENKISKVEIGQPVEISGNGFEDGTYYGYVQTISPSASKAYVGANEETVVYVTLSIENCDSKIKSGYSAKTKIITEPVEKLNIISYESIKQDKNGQEYVYVFNKGFAVRRDIQTGIELGEGVEVVSGLESDDIVIFEAENIEKSGTLVKVIN